MVHHKDVVFIKDEDDAETGVQQLVRELSELSIKVDEQFAEVRGKLDILMTERHSRQKWMSRGVTLWVGVITIVGGGAILHLLHWGP